MKEENEKENEKDEEGARALSPESTRKPVKSTAVVKYTNVQAVATFAQLCCNTDLNLPPSNWLSCSAQNYGLHYQPSINVAGFTSFHMAHMFPDCVGEVDVVSDAENIKKLLKLPYSKGTISMMVHRVGNTLLIDDFDIHKYLLKEVESEWTWLRKFFFENILQTINHKEKIIPQKNRKRYTLQRRNLTSKFLYHSLDMRNAEPLPEPAATAIPLPDTEKHPPLPEPQLKEKLPGSSSSQHEYFRNVIWTFENIQMLIGTDMPIFGGPNHPCVSLRLENLEKPINILTGLDYWLDNLMCNVPELVMCYHLLGIVQKYELIKTEDVPHLENSKFSPKVVRDVAQNILSFLRSNTTKAGHTYWLFKGKDDEFIKLYDLTSLCSDVSEDKDQNPFTVPVAMLLYRMARNLSRSAEESSQNAGTIHFLLERCISLLDKEKYSQIVTSAHYMLSDIFIPNNTDPADPASLDGEVVTSKLPNGAGEVALSLNTLCIANEDAQHDDGFLPCAGPLVRGAQDRCLRALEHVFQGFESLQYLPDEPIQKDSGESAKLAKPFEPIPMSYSPLNKSSSEKKVPDVKEKKNKKNRTQPKDKNAPGKNIEASGISLLHKTELPLPLSIDGHVAWKLHLERLLIRKAVLAYATLAEDAFLIGNYGQALGYIKCLITFFQNLSIDEIRSYILGRAGDCCCMMAKKWSDIEKQQNDYIEASQNNSIPKKNFEKITEPLPDKFLTPVDLLKSGLELYKRAIVLSKNNDSLNNLKKRLGNVNNELGSIFLKEVNDYLETEEEPETKEKIEILLNKAQKYLTDGIKAFLSAHDSTNIALLYSNQARLFRIRAFSAAQGTLQKIEGNLYEKAITIYNKAFSALGSRKCAPEVWDSITWELSSTLFTYATQSQDYLTYSKPKEEMKKEVSKRLKRALDHCPTDVVSFRQPLYQYRAATLYFRLGSLYHSSYRDLPDISKHLKIPYDLAIQNYEKAFRLLVTLEEPVKCLELFLQYIKILEPSSTAENSFKIKTLTEILKLFSRSVPFISFISKKYDFSKIVDKNEEWDKVFNYMKMYINKLHETFRTILSLSKKNKEIPIESYKVLYRASLEINIENNLHNLEDFLRKLKI